MATKKVKKIIKRVNGKPVVVFEDINTGQQFGSMPKGYELVSADTTDIPSTDTKTNKPTTKPIDKPYPENQTTNASKAEGFDAQKFLADRGSKSSFGMDDVVDGLGIRDDLQRFKEGGNNLFAGIKSFIVERMAPSLAPEMAANASAAIADAAPGIATGAADAASTAGDAIGSGVAVVGNAVGNLFGVGGEPAPPMGGTEVANIPNEAGQPKTLDPEWMSYSPGIATRKLPVSEFFKEHMGAAIAATDPTLGILITSGGQPKKGDPFSKDGISYSDRVGSTRHDINKDGTADTADFFITRNGENIKYQDEPDIYRELAKYAAAVGFTGLGHYDGGFIHVGMGDVAAWGPDTTSKSVDPAFADAVSTGMEMAASGEGQRILQAYEQSVYKEADTAVNNADIPPELFQPDPKLVEAMNGIRESVGEAPVTVNQPLDPVPVGDTGQPGVAAPINEAPTSASDSILPTTPIETPATEAIDQAVVDQTDAALDPIENQSSYAPSGEAMPSATPLDITQPIPGVTPDIAGKELDNIQLGYLNLLNDAEGKPRYNQAFNYQEFDDLSDHPRGSVYNSEFDVDVAGAYQIKSSTWDEHASKLGITDFYPDSQDRVAWSIAEDRYNRYTDGRDLYQDLASDDPNDNMRAIAGNAPTWVSLPGGSHPKYGIDTAFQKFQSFKSASDGGFNLGMSEPTGLGFKDLGEPIGSTELEQEVGMGVTPTSKSTGFSKPENVGNVSSSSNTSSGTRDNTNMQTQKTSDKGFSQSTKASSSDPFDSNATFYSQTTKTIDKNADPNSGRTTPSTNTGFSNNNKLNTNNTTTQTTNTNTVKNTGFTQVPAFINDKIDDDDDDDKMNSKN